MIVDKLITLIQQNKISIEYTVLDNKRYKKKKCIWRLVVRPDGNTVERVYDSEDIFDFLPFDIIVKNGVSQIWFYEGLIEIYYDNDDRDFDHVLLTNENWEKHLC